MEEQNETECHKNGRSPEGAFGYIQFTLNRYFSVLLFIKRMATCFYFFIGNEKA